MKKSSILTPAKSIDFVSRVRHNTHHRPCARQVDAAREGRATMSRGQMEGYSRICTQSWGLPSNDERGWLVDRIPRRGLPDSGQEGEAVSLLVQQEALESIVLDYRGKTKEKKSMG
jgi:hypothetical protein